MKRFLILAVVALFTLGVVLPAQGAVKFKDMPDSHWAADAVYDLVRMGITSGYPDGTFRGTNTLNRYEIAVFLSKLAQAVKKEAGSVDLMPVQKAQAELKAEIDRIKMQIASRPQITTGGPMISGSAAMSHKLGKAFASDGTKGLVVDYRLKTTIAQKLDNGAAIKVNLDTMDSGYYNSGATIANLIDVEGTLKADMGLPAPVDIKITAGPGAQQNTTTILNGENGEVYDRPDNGISAATKLLGTSIGLGYKAVNVSAVSEATINQFTASLGFDLMDFGMGKLPVLGAVSFGVKGDVFYKSMDETGNDVKVTLDMTSKPVKGLELYGALGMANINSMSQDDLMLCGAVKYADYYKTGTNVTFKGTAVGGAYYTSGYSQGDLGGVNIFKKYVSAGTADFGGEVTQVVNKKVTLIGKADMVTTTGLKYGSGYANTGLSIEGGVNLAVAKGTKFGARYRYTIDANADNSYDMAGIGLVYNF